MQINLSGQHVDVSPALKDYVHNKFERLERHFDHVSNVNVVLTVEKLRQKAEATVHAAGASLFAEAVNEDMYAAIDALTDKLNRQVTKHKEKLKNHHRNNGRQEARAANE